MEAFRRSLNGLHTWAGITLGALLFAIFWMGTLSVFDDEIDAWMKPEARVALASALSLDDDVLPLLPSASDGIESVRVELPNERAPLLHIHAHGEKADVDLIYDPTTMELVDETDSLAATGFIYPFHYDLHLHWNDIGIWIVGCAALVMMTLLVSGVFIHRKIIADFFTFRPTKAARRSTLDLHNVTGVLALPFHFIMPLSGLVIFFGTYLPWAIAAPYGGDIQPLLEEGGYGGYSREVAGQPWTEPPLLDRIVETAESRLTNQVGSAEMVRSVGIYNYGDAKAYVVTYTSPSVSRVTTGTENLAFDATTGKLVHDYVETRPMRSAEGWLMALHKIQFDHWPLRWLYFVGGLMGCVMIATGNLFWMRARIARSGDEPTKVRLVRALTIGAVTGIILATGAFLTANRLLLREAAFAGYERAALEIWVFFIVWIGTLVHAAIREKAAWRDQCWAIATVSLLAIALNWITTGDHLAASIGGGLWAVAGMDMVLLAGAGIAAVSALRLSRRPVKPAERKLKPSQATGVPAE